MDFNHLFCGHIVISKYPGVIYLLTHSCIKHFAIWKIVCAFNFPICKMFPIKIRLLDWIIAHFLKHFPAFLLRCLQIDIFDHLIIKFGSIFHIFSMTKEQDGARTAPRIRILLTLLAKLFQKLFLS